jgi:sodium/potassium-transporting ATPase subunit alpha
VCGVCTCFAGLGGLLILSIDLITEQGPAISLAYEPAEALVMERPPRDMTRDRLVDGPLLRYAYLVAGVLNVSLATAWAGASFL